MSAILVLYTDTIVCNFYIVDTKFIKLSEEECIFCCSWVSRHDADHQATDIQTVGQKQWELGKQHSCRHICAIKKDFWSPPHFYSFIHSWFYILLQLWFYWTRDLSTRPWPWTTTAAAPSAWERTLPSSVSKLCWSFPSWTLASKLRWGEPTGVLRGGRSPTTLP